ncbi:Heat shock protein 70 [[Leptolyngbya] sp. PCC 7376]|uniref:Hsp70 family protein n=1 Tax=[Leptolyngbya] sp. PCC 7376 TaxID=111781 RepID=UPI00029F2F78|nr:Hsp70 family protein [[Leptolyngbya] sp. PCC 7376]AFY37640.1 Heat shock protein 70 [[Leptolyngbya] sp. PCC 7376]
MSKWRLKIGKVLQALCSPLLKLLGKLKAFGNVYRQLDRTCDKLQRQLDTQQTPEKIGQTYTQALSLARKCNCDELTKVILQFDSLVAKQNAQDGLVVGQAISFLIDARPQTTPYLEAAWQLSQRLGKNASILEVQQQICLQIAQIGDSNLLLGRLLERRNQGSLSTTALSQIIYRFLENHTFQFTDSWKAFFKPFRPDELPQIHQVYAVLDRYAEAAKLAETARDYHSAIDYLMPLPGQDIALHNLELANRLGDESEIAKAHHKVAGEFWQEGNYAKALEHFQKSSDRQRSSDCHQQLGELEAAIRCRPDISPEWIQEIRTTLENQVRDEIEQQEFLTAVRSLKSIEEAWQDRSQTAEAERIKHLLSGAVRAARSAFEHELDASDGQTTKELLKRWSLLEEAAGNYLEAGQKAEQAEDYFAASILFEKAKAFGQALVALKSAEPEAVDSRKKAQLLEQGGDFFMAASLYESLGEIDQAIALYERAAEFSRAAELQRHQLSEETAPFDQRWQELLTKAGQTEKLAELCATQASRPEQSAEQKTRLWRRIKNLTEQGLLGEKWRDLIVTELPLIEEETRHRFEQQAVSWLPKATQQVMANYTDAIGLDLGTSNSVVCLFNKQQGKPEVVERQRKRQIPSIFAIDQTGRELVGIPIPELLSKSPRAIITKAKREMGTSRKFRVGGKDYRPEEISARIINTARQFAREFLQQKIAAKISGIAAKEIGSIPPTDWVNEFLRKHPPNIPLNNIVITVPAYFNEAQKQATKTAGILANVHVLRLIHEPTAGCLAKRIQENKSETILVADMGAGTFDLSIIQAGDGFFEVLEIEGDSTLGSTDLDDLIYSYFNNQIQSETGQEIPRNSQAATRLRQACEELKIELSSQPEWTIDLPYLIGDRTIQLALTREELEHLASDWLKRIQSTCKRIQHRPNKILLIGGGALMPAVHRSIRELFNQEPNSAYDPLTLVARGAALQAALLMGDVQEKILLDAVPFSLGIKCQETSGEFRFDSVIAKHTTIPTCKTKRYSTVEDDQTRVVIEIFQGESSVPDENFKIGEFILRGIPIAKASVPQIDVKFDIDVSCLLTVTARDASTGNQQSISITDSHLLTPAQATTLQTRFRQSQLYQESLADLETLAADLKAILNEVDKANLADISARFQDRIQTYEQYQERYSPTVTDNNILLNIYGDRLQLEDKTRLLLDQWGTLSRSIQLWLDQYDSMDWRSTDIEVQVQHELATGKQLRQRTQDTKTDINRIVANYQKWLNTLENLPINPQGNPEDLAQHFLRLQRYPEALTQFQRLTPPLLPNHIELGLELFAHTRQRDAYFELLSEHTETLGIHRPDFKNLNHTVRTHSSSIVWLKVDIDGQTFHGSGFAIDSQHIATNRHVLIDKKTGSCVPPEKITAIAKEEILSVISIHEPSWGMDDVVILRIQSNSTPLTPLRLGFSELVEVGELIMTIGFPSPESGEFTENLYCNTGLVNRVRSSQFCTERILEVSIPLQGGISGAPVLNQAGEVIGLLTFWTDRQRTSTGGQIYHEQSLYAIPVQILRRLYGEIN